MSDVEIFPNRSDLVRAEAERFVKIAHDAIAASGRCTLALAGGSTPRPLYELLATDLYRTRIDWARTHLFWGDERCVPPEHPESNYRMTRMALIDHVPLPAENVHRISGEDEPGRAADAYEALLREFFGQAEVPERSFDLVLLGMGSDGHTASIFPGTAAATESRRWAMAVHVTHPHEMWRVTLTRVVLNAAADVTFLVTGANKAPRLRDVVHDGEGRPPLPAQLVRPSHGTLHWMADSAAAAELVPIIT